MTASVLGERGGLLGIETFRVPGDGHRDMVWSAPPAAAVRSGGEGKPFAEGRSPVLGSWWA
ncbi:MAG: hypothetical protein ACRD0U_11955 [Acidimicrobiales bacterium]